MLGSMVGIAVPTTVGETVGTRLENAGLVVGEKVGNVVGWLLGNKVGDWDG